MPLRDHFHPPWSARYDWESFHSGWVNTIVRHLNERHLSRRYRSAPQVRLGALVEVDVATVEDERAQGEHRDGNGVATALWAPPRPARTYPVTFPAEDLFEVQVYDSERGTRLVAAVEMVSPRNKDRPSARRAFAVKCASYLQQQVSVVIVDVVSDRHDDLSAELLRLLDLAEGPGWAHQPPLYAIACRTIGEGESWQLETWPEALRLGAALPTLPLWLAANLAVPLELEATYEETYRVLRLE